MTDLPGIAPHIQLSKEGIWVPQSEENAELSYPAEGHDFYFDLEDKSFWFAHRNSCIEALIRNFGPPGPLFDVGGGNGFVSQSLQKAGFEVVLIEPGVVGAINAKRRGVKTVVCSTLQKAGFKDHSLPSVGLFDVLEHVQNDKDFLKDIHNLLAPDGKLYLTVPAHNSLWSHEDQIAGHYRRYSLRTLDNLLQQAGFKIEYGTYFFSPLLLPIFLLRSLPSLWGKRPPSPVASKKDHNSDSVGAGILNQALSWELGKIQKQKKLLMGASCLVVAQPVSP